VTTKEKALLLLRTIKSELAQGTKHYDSRDPGKPVTSVLSIIELMVEGFLQIQPVAERRHLFDCFTREKENGSS